MELPIKLQSKIIDFLKALPNIDDTNSRRAFIYSLGLDSELKEQISFDQPPAQFVPLLVSKLLHYGKLIDGRYAIIAILEEAEGYIGEDRKAYCKLLIQEIYSQQSLPVNERVDNVLAEIRRALFITKSNFELKANLYKVDAYLSTNPHNIEAKLLKDTIIRAINYENPPMPQMPNMQPECRPISRSRRNIFPILSIGLLALLILLYFLIRWLW